MQVNSRMEKYEEENNARSRTKKNEKLYRDISYDEIDEVNLASNAHIIGDNNKNIDINKIKEILETKYREEPKKRSSLNLPESELQEENIESTKEYDIKTILEKAKSQKEVDYEKERLKKIRDTQYDILKSLDVQNESKENKEELMELIDTINENENTRKLEPLDILTDLKGDDNTVVIEGMKEKIEEESLEESSKEVEVLEDKKENLTDSLSFTQSDFDDFNDLKEDVNSNKILVKILFVIVILALVIGVIVVLNTVLKLNIF